MYQSVFVCMIGYILYFPPFLFWLLISLDLSRVYFARVMVDNFYFVLSFIYSLYKMTRRRNSQQKKESEGISSATDLFIYFSKVLFIWQRTQADREAGQERGREAGSLLSRQPDGLNPRSLGSWPELKAEALTHWTTQAPQWRAFLNGHRVSVLQDEENSGDGWRWLMVA